MKKLVLIWGMVAASAVAVAQNKIKLEIHSGYATYRMLNMKDYQAQLAASSGVQLTTNDAFPPFGYFEGTVLYSFQEKFSLGVWVSSNSTGGRTSRSDFSGSLIIDQLVRCVGMGFNAEMLLAQKGKGEFFVRARMGTREGRMRLITRLELAEEVSQEEEKFKSSNFVIGASAGYRYNIGRVYFGVEAGLDADRSDKLIFANDKKVYLVDDNDKEVTLDWTGARIGFSLGVKLK